MSASISRSSSRTITPAGFVVFNHVTYPLLTRLFKELNVETKPTSMSFSVAHLGSGIEYNGTSLNHLFSQRRNLFSPRFWRFLRKINRFNAEAAAALDDPLFSRMTLREYAETRGYGKDFLNLYIIPMGSAVWSTPPELMLEFPSFLAQPRIPRPEHTILLLGNIAMAIYMLIQLFRVPANAKIETVLLR